MRTILLLFVGFAGCGGDTLVRAQLADLQKRLDDTQRRAAVAERKAEDLQDQVFLLTDKLESQKVKAQHAPAPRLPVVLLKPDQPEADPVAGDDIEFVGAARSKDPEHTRPRLVLTGDSQPQASESRTQTTARTRTQSTRTQPQATRTQAIAPEGDNLGVAPVPPIPHGDDAVALYKRASAELHAGQNDEAAKLFRELVRRFPDHDLADNAQYWLGECYYGRKQYTEAIAEFRLVLTKYPLGNKAPDALLKLAYSYLAVGDPQKGRDLLKQVPESYPHSEAARLAQLRLAELATTGGTQ